MAMASFLDWIDKSATISSILRLCLLESLGGGGSASPAGASFILCTLEIGGTMLPPFVRDWTSLLQRHLRVDSRLLSQSFEHSAPSLVESVGDACPCPGSTAGETKMESR